MNKHYLKYKDTIQAYCKEYYQKNKDLIKERSRQYKINNKEKTKEYQRLYSQRNKEKRLLYYRDYRRNNRKKVNEYYQIRGKNDHTFRLNRNITNALGRSLKQMKAGRKWEDLLGYTLQQLVIHLERRFDDKMSWENYGSYWHVDHIKPKSLFSIKDFREAWALNNLQPLEAHENKVKYNKY